MELDIHWIKKDIQRKCKSHSNIIFLQIEQEIALFLILELFKSTT